MDIKSLIDTEDTSLARKASVPLVSKQASRSSQDGILDSSYDQRVEVGLQRDGRPPQLSSLQTPGPQDSRYLHRSSYGSASSSNQQPQINGRSIVRYPSPQQHPRSPPNVYHPAQYFPQDNRSSLGTPTHLTAGPSTPVTHTPTGSTPGSAGAFCSWQRPTSSHSASTPTSAQYAPQNFLRESSQASNSHNGSLPHLIATHQMSPQSSAPLAPPSTRPRPVDFRQDSPGSSTHKRSLSGELRGQQRLDGHSQSEFHTPSAYGPSPPHTRAYYEREKSISISPKTTLASFPPPEPMALAKDHNDSRTRLPSSGDSRDGNGPLEGSHLDEAGVRPNLHRSTSLGIQGLLNEEPQREVNNKPGNQGFRNSGNEVPESLHDSIIAPGDLGVNPQASQVSSRSGPSTADQRSDNAQKLITSHIPPDRENTASQTSGHQNASLEITSDCGPGISTGIARNIRADLATTEPSWPQAQADNHTKGALSANNYSALITQASTLASAPTLPSQPAKKKARLNGTKTSPLIPEDRNDPPSIPPESTLQQKKKKPPRIPTPIFAQSVRNTDPSRTSSHDTSQSGRRDTADKVRQQHPNSQCLAKGVPIPAPQPSMDKGPLGHWEPTILNIIPTDEVVKVVSDFLFTQVLVNDGIDVAPAGSSAGRGAVLEIEAKIGRIIDKNTMDRLQLPVMTETVLNRDHPNIRTHFESSMTEAQHRVLNGFLNKALIATQAAKPTPHNPNPTPNDRVRMDYKHTKETDTFYDLSQSGLLALPQSITSITNHSRSGGKTKVRITHDQKTGKELAKIVKARIADVDIYSPQNQADWRISVNVEMDFEGDMRHLVETEKRDGKRADRNKDRMSYRHQAYQIDLTQVTAAEATPLTHKEHELEIEVSSEEVRRQATLLQRGEVNQFADLITGFVDNVRTLARQVPVDHHPL
ncbi:MAG: hypothetical protein Q9217_003520 [Psora testacea]